MEQALISIVTVVKNGKAHLEKTVRSIRNQSYKNIEYIVIDGQSTDGTLDVVQDNLDVIKLWKSEPDTGIYDAMNKGKNMASGHFAFFMNAGDEFYTDDALAILCKNALQRPNDLHYGFVKLFNKNISWEYRPIQNYDYSVNRYIPHHQSVLYPRIFYKENDYDLRFRISGDVDYSIRASQQFGMSFTPVCLIKSELNGYGVHVFKSIKGVKLYIKELEMLTEMHPLRYVRLSKPSILLKGFIKMFLYKIGGTYALAASISGRVKFITLMQKSGQGNQS